MSIAADWLSFMVVGVQSIELNCGGDNLAGVAASWLRSRFIKGRSHQSETDRECRQMPVNPLKRNAAAFLPSETGGTSSSLRSQQCKSN